MSAVPSSSTRKPIDTTLSVPGAPAASPAFGDRDLVAAAILPSAAAEAAFDAEHARHAEAPDVGVEHADGEPAAASAAARFTVTDDLPTPPLPLATASTRVVDGTSVGAASLAGVEPGALHRRRLLLLGHLAVLDLHRRSRRGGRAPSTRRRCLIWPRSGQPAVVSATFTMTSPSGPTRDVVDHAEVDDAGVELGVDHARRACRGRRRATAAGPRAAGGRGRPGRRDRVRAVVASCPIKTV